MRKKISAVLAASMIATNVSPSINVFASEVVKEKTKIIEENVVSKAKITPFNLSEYSNYEDYNSKFRVLREEIKSISNNGGQYSSSSIDKAIDGNISTHWETRRENSSNFKNEVVVEFNNVESINRIAYATRQDGAKGKGFPIQFEIYSSITENDDDFKLVSTGEHSSTGNMMEFKFDTITTKKVKFVFKEAHNNWASASEFWFYKEDQMLDKLNTLFTDSNMNEVSESFNDLDKLSKLEEEAKDHPFYENFKEDIDNARIILASNEIESTKAKVSKLTAYGTEYEDAYNERFMIETNKITKVEANGGIYPGTKYEYMFDGDPNTHWETNRGNSTDFTNEITLTLDEAQTIDRLAYKARSINSKGFPTKFEIHVSQTSKGQTFQKIATGEAKVTSDMVEFKFLPTKAKRVKLVFNECNENRAFASEMRLYKHDELSEKYDNLFTNSSKNTISEEFNTLEKLTAFENELKNHPMAELYKEDIENAKILISKDNIEATTVLTSKFEHYTNQAYNEMFKIDRSKIKKISTNGGQYGSQKIEHAIDDNLDTYWETSKPITSTFNHEIEVEFNETVTINRIAYGARKSDRKGFAQEFEIYGSKTSKGDTYELIATGKYNVVSGLVEAKFKTNEFRRIKFKFVKASQDWATMSELVFYKEDKLADKMDNLFTNNLMNELSEEFNSKEALDALEKEVKTHPAADTFMEKIDMAKEILAESQKTTKVITVEQRGNMTKHGSENLLIPLGNNNLPTGISASPGETLIVYVEPAGNGTVPSLVFTQQEGSYHSWERVVTLNAGRNVIEVPKVGADFNITKGGPIYLRNPYTAEEQGKAPVVRFEGGTAFPMATKDIDPEEFKKELKEYKLKMDEDAAENPNVVDRKLVDVVEMVSDHIVFTGTASEAYNQFVVKGKNPLDTLEGYDYMMNKVFLEYGLDGRSEIHDPKNIRENIRFMQPVGAMYAAGNHTGIQRGTIAHMLSDFRESKPGWGIIHEIGHRMAVGVREYGEVTNNMLAMAMSIEWNDMDTRIPFEKIYKSAIEENKVAMTDRELFERLGAFWQLELAHPGYWTELNSLYRERKITLENGDNSKQQYLVKFSSEVLGVDLSSHFARHGFTVNSETREELKAKYPASNKVWYLNNSLVGYEGDGIKDKNAKIEVSISIDKTNNSNVLKFKIDDEYSNDLLGYEIYRDEELIGFTSTSNFTDTEIDSKENYTYTIVGYDKKLDTLNPVNVKAFKPNLFTEKNVTLKLNEEFIATNYVKATSYDGNDITENVVVKSDNVDSYKKGEYTVVFEVIDNGVKETKTMNVSVVSNYDYLSDEQWESVETQWGTPRKNTDIKGRVNGAVKEFEKGIGIHANGKITYDLSNKGYERFEALLGVDMGIAAQNNSSITFKIVGDGENLATTKVLKHADDMVYVNVDVKDVEKLVIEINNGGNGNTSDHAVIANPKLITNNAKPKLTVEDKTYKLGETIDFKAGVKASDTEDGDLTSQVEIVSNNYEEGKLGRFEVVYRVTDSDMNVSEKKAYVTVYEDFTVNKSKFGQFDNLEKYNEKFKLNVSSVSNNGGSYPGSDIGNTIDGNINTHWETNRQNSDTFKSEVIFDLGESQEISKIAYAARRTAGGKGFANKFEIYVSNEVEGNDFILAGKGEYRGNSTDVVEFNISKTTARRVMFKFIEANQGWASIGEMSFYKDDTLAKKIANDLFTDNTKAEVSQAYNTLDKLQALREDVKNHPAVKLFEEDLNKAEQIIKTKYPTLKAENTVYSLEDKVNILDGVTATDKEEGNITSRIEIKSSNYVEGKLGKFTVVYAVTDREGLTSEATREIFVTNEETQLSSLNWESATIGSGAVRKNRAVSGNSIRLLGENNNVETFEKGIGTHSYSEIVYNSEGYDVLDTWVGVDQTVANKDVVMAGNAGTVEFEIYVDGKKVATSGVMKADTPKKRMVVDVTESKQVKLVVATATNGNNWDHANWADAKFHKMVGMDRSELEAVLEEAESLDLNNYSDETITVLEEAIAAGKEALEIDNQELINTATEALRKAIESLVEVNLNEVVNITDEYLEQSLQKALNKTGDITLGDMRSLTNLTLSGVSDLTGMEYARNLETLSMEYNQVKDLRLLANLDKIKVLDANKQYIESGELTPSNGKVVFDSKVYNREGHNVVKTIKLVDNTGNTILEQNPEDESFISTEGLDKGLYGVHIIFEDDGFDGVMFYLFSIK